jgi:hypothetical protein
MNDLESIWSSLLSRDTGEIRKKFAQLDPASRKVTLEHLQNMVTTAGWHPEQVASARIALHALAERKGLDPDK